MNGKIPQSPDWCVSCIEDKKPCRYHRGTNTDTFVDYLGPEVYYPTPEVLAIIGQKLYGPGDMTTRGWECFGFDPRLGFWIRSIDCLTTVQKNISQRAINRTFHVIKMTPGPKVLLNFIQEKNRFPDENEFDFNLESASQVLFWLGYLTEEFEIIQDKLKESAYQWQHSHKTNSLMDH